MTRIQIGDKVVLAVQVRDGQYHLMPPHTQLTHWPSSEHGLTCGADTWFAVLTGCTWGRIDVTVESLTAAPSALSTTEWAMTVERSIATAPSQHLTISDPYGPVQHTIDTPRSDYRARIHCRGRDRDQPEHHLIQLWPASPERGELLLVGPDAIAAQFQG